MKFIVNKTVEIIKRNIPASDGETMIRIDGFEDIRFYDALARAITHEFEGSNLSVDIKLANNKWQYFSKDSTKTSYLHSLKQHGWVAENESITRYRNLHKSNILILMGTELEEDKGGLQQIELLVKLSSRQSAIEAMEHMRRRLVPNSRGSLQMLVRGFMITQIFVIKMYVSMKISVTFLWLKTIKCPL